MVNNKRPSSRPQVSNARKVERERERERERKREGERERERGGGGGWRDKARERTFEIRARCRMDAEVHRRQHRTGGHGSAERQHRAGRQPILQSRGTGFFLPARARTSILE